MILHKGREDKMTGKEAKKRLEEQYKRQNQHIRDNYDRVSITIPKGMKEAIKEKHGSINGYINRLITEDMKMDL